MNKFIEYDFDSEVSASCLFLKLALRAQITQSELCLSLMSLQWTFALHEAVFHHA